MTTPLESLVASGTKLWLDSVDPELVRDNVALGATGATSNPIIISDLIRTGRFDDQIGALVAAGHADSEIAWEMTDRLVRQAQQVFHPVWKRTEGNDGYVSFELDPLLEDVGNPLSVDERRDQYITLGRQWAEGHDNRMIKVPATEAGLAALEELAASGVTLNVTLLFSSRQYRIARDAIWRGAQRTDSPTGFKSVYSIFVSRIDVYSKKAVPELSAAAQGQVGILNAQRIWQENDAFWADKGTGRQQEMIFASTGTKDAADPPDKYVAALAGSDIQTNPPATNAAIQQMDGRTFSRLINQLPPPEVQAEIDDQVDFAEMERVLMDEGLRKFADPQKGLLDLIANKRATVASGA